MRETARVLLALATLVATVPMLCACYTAKGAGEDLKAAGQGISNSADKNTGYKP